MWKFDCRHEISRRYGPDGGMVETTHSAASHADACLVKKCRRPKLALRWAKACSAVLRIQTGARCSEAQTKRRLLDASPRKLGRFPTPGRTGGKKTAFIPSPQRRRRWSRELTPLTPSQTRPSFQYVTVRSMRRQSFGHSDLASICDMKAPKTGIPDKFRRIRLRPNPLRWIHATGTYLLARINTEDPIIFADYDHSY